VLATSLFVVHDTGGSGQDHVSELTGGQELDDPLLEIAETNIVAGGNDTGLVETAVELNHNLAASMIIDFFELADVTVLLHDAEELDDDLGGRADQDLSLPRLLGVVDGVECIVED